MLVPTLTRILKHGMQGKDVQGVRRGCCRFVGRPVPTAPVAYQRKFNDNMLELVKASQDQAVIPKTGVVGPELMAALRRADAFDLYAKQLLAQYAAEHADQDPPMVSPVPKGVNVHVGGLHSTAGLAGNWALDWICAPGTPILCPEDAVIRKLSGRSPADDTMDSQGVYGWSVHFETGRGYRYFATHFGRRANLTVGQKVQSGDTLGWVGDQDFRPDHIHLGVTSPFGSADAKRRIQAVRDAPRVDA
jgi:murein DD-endopeptidase MepM/ murein hydrolase activator NlpD